MHKSIILGVAYASAIYGVLLRWGREKCEISNGVQGAMARRVAANKHSQVEVKIINMIHYRSPYNPGPNSSFFFTPIL